MNITQKRRLKALLAKAEADRTDAEKQEVATLQGLAKTANYDPAQDEGTLTEEDVRLLVQEGVTEGMGKALKSLKIEDEVTAAFTKSLKEHKGELSSEVVEELLKKHIGAAANIDAKELTAEIKSFVTETAKGTVTNDQLEKALKDFGEKHLRSQSKHQFGGGNELDAFPIEHRSGNLDVAGKQLLNIMLSGVSDEALARSNGGRGIERPKGMNDGIPAEMLKSATMRGQAAVKSLRNTLMSGRKALTTTGSGTGLELVNTELSSTLLARFYLESQLASELLASEVDMPSDPFKFPMTTTRPVFYVGSEAPGSDPTDSDPGTQNVTLDAAKLIGLTNYSYEADEDAVVAVLPMIQEGLASGAADAFEGAVINGDADGTHQDSDIHAVSGHHAKLFNGLRKAALGITELKVDLATGGISAPNFLALKKAMVKYGIRPRDLMCIVGVKGYNDFVGLDETLTAEKVGNSQARILTGEAPSLFGVRIIVSSQMREDLNASGVYAASSSKGTVLLVHKPSWLVGVRRGFTVEVDVDKKRQINSVIASFRRAFSPKETPSAAQAIVAIGYNYAA